MSKRILFSFFLFSLSQFNYAQCSNDCITRGTLAGLIYEVVYNQDDPDNYQPMVNYPTAYLDGSGDAELDKKISLVSYLDYNDGVRVLGHMDTSGYLLTNGIVGRGEAIVALMEAWDISPDFTGGVSYFDVDSSHEYYGYINEAEDLGLMDGIFGSNFNSNYGITSNEFVQMIVNIQNSSYHPVSTSTLQNPNNYFTPNNYQPDNLGLLRGLEQGVFSHYAKNSFVIPDIKFNLNFSHYYSTQMVELPQSYFPIQPLGRGWTHTYNTYIIRENNVGADEIDYYYIKWADGSIDIYNEDDEEYVTLGVYDELQENTGGFDIVITKKNQTKYFFDRYSISGPDEPIYYLEKIQDSNGNTIFLSYEESDVDSNFLRLETVTAPSGKELNFYYHNNTDFVDYIEDPIGRQIRFTYNEERLKYFYDAKNQDTKYYYVSNDEDAPEEHQYKRFLLRKVRLPEQNIIEAEYDEDDNGKLESYQINDAETIIDVDYSDYEAITSTVEVPMPTGGTQDFDYEFDAYGMVSEFQNDTQDISINYPDPTNDNPLLPTNVDVNGLDVYYDYDDKGNVTDIQVENNEDKDFWYDDSNNLIRYRDENNNNTYFQYDILQRNLLSIEDALGNSIYFNYDIYGQVTSITNQEGITVNYTYDDGVVTSITAPEGLESSFDYDGVNRLISKTINGQTTSFDYDPNDNLTSHTNIGGLTTTFNYDQNDNLITITNANGVNTSFTYNDDDQVTSENFNGLIKQYGYNDDGTLDTYTKPSGDVIEYDYLSNGKLNGAGTILDLDYYSSSDGKKEGLLWRIYNENGHYEFDYNNLNRLDHVRDEYNLEDTYYEYDNVGNVTEIDYPDKGVTFNVHYNYDAKNRMTRVRANIDGSYITIAEYEYRDDDLLDRILYGNNTRGYFIYDNAGRKTGVSYSIYDTPNSGLVLFAENVTLDNRGNITSEERYYLEEENSPTLSLQTPSYTYNQNNHLTSVNGLPVTINDDGNTTSRQVESNGTGIPEATISYTYDLDDRLTNVTSSNTIPSYPVEYQYDVYGNRVKRFTNNGNNYQYYTWDLVNNNVILEESNFEDDIYYVYGATGLEVSINAHTGDIIYYFMGDIRGSVIATVEEDNQNYQLNKYDDFGKLIKGEYGITSTESFKYLGKYGITLEQLDLGHYNIKARHYDADIGRFLTQDPIWSTNLYPYSNNNPTSNIDKNGKCFEGITTNYSQWAYNFNNSTFNSMLNAIGIKTQYNSDINRCGEYIGILASIAPNFFTKGAGPIIESTTDSIGDLIYGNTITSEESLLRVIDQFINLTGITGARVVTLKEEIYNLFKEFNVTQRALDSSKASELIDTLLFEILIPYSRQ